MWSYFLRNWHSTSQGDQADNAAFRTIIQPLADTILSNFRALQQEYEFLDSCLPFKIKADNLGDNLDYLVGLYGHLTAYIYENSKDKGDKITISYEKIKALGVMTPDKSRNIV